MQPSSTELSHRIVALERLLGLNDASLRGTFHLSEACANLLGLLISRGSVPFRLDGNDLGGIVNPRTTVSRLRKQLQPWNIAIHTRYGQGYFITPEDRQRIRTMLAGEPPQAELDLAPQVAWTGARLTEHERASISKCRALSFAELSNPNLHLVAVPLRMVKGIEALVKETNGH